MKKNYSLHLFVKDFFIHDLLILILTFFFLRIPFLSSQTISNDSTNSLIQFVYIPEALAHRSSVKKVFLEISQNPQENTRARVPFLIKLKPWRLQLY